MSQAAAEIGERYLSRSQVHQTTPHSCSFLSRQSRALELRIDNDPFQASVGKPVFHRAGHSQGVFHRDVPGQAIVAEFFFLLHVIRNPLLSLPWHIRWQEPAPL